MRQGKNQVSRRKFLKGAAAGAATFAIASPDILGGPGRTAPNDKMGVAFIGCGGRGGAQVGGLSGGNNVVGLCDVDGRRAAGSFNRFAQAPKFKDFRRMLDKVGKEADVVAVSTPDHTHAVACMAALKLAKHVYCEKPLAHSVHEVRALMAEASRRTPAALEALGGLTRALAACQRNPGDHPDAARIAAALSTALHGIAMLNRTDTPSMWLSDVQPDEVLRTLVDSAIAQQNYPAQENR